MHDKELYAQILGIVDPWTVTEVDLDLKSGEVRVHVEIPKGDALPCPECGQPCSRHDARQRRWRHLDTCQYHTILIADVPRINCPDHKVRQVRVPWAEPGSQFTALFELLVIDWLQAANISAVAKRLDMTWDQVDGIMARAVRRGLRRRKALAPRRIGIDETSFQKRHEYVTVVTDSETSHVLYVADDRKQESLDGFFESLPTEKRASIESVSMDMWAPYMKAVRRWIPNADEKIAFDKFHVARHLGNAVNQVRRREHKELKAVGDTRLKGTMHLWLQNPGNISRKRWSAFQPLRESTLRTARAWGLKEIAMTLWDYKTRGWARRAWKWWLAWASRSRLKPFVRAARLIRKHLQGIINAIVLRATNAGAESINAIIQRVKARACGYRNRDRFRRAIMFYAGGLDLRPAI